MATLETTAAALDLRWEELQPYGDFAAKIPLAAFSERPRSGRLVLVSALNPTPAGEGKTTMTIGIADALRRIGARAGIALREPSLGPVMGRKGGGTGGGRSTIEPSTEINLHFTHDFSAVSSAHNLLAALADNAVHHGLIGPASRLTIRRVLDHNDRALRRVTIGKTKSGATERDTGFDIVAASEVMAILCLSKGLGDLEERLARMIVGLTPSGDPIRSADLDAQGAMTALLRHAIEPNLARSGEGTPAFVHGGPFANIAHGTNSLLATWAGLSTCDILVTEAGFGFDLGAEKYLNLVCPLGGFSPSVIVLVVTARSLRMHGGRSLDTLEEPDPAALERGLANLEKHLETLDAFSLPGIVAINSFQTDSEDEIRIIEGYCRARGVDAVVTKTYLHGGRGGENIARLILDKQSGSAPRTHSLLYDWDSPVPEKIERIANLAYGAAEVRYTEQARQDLATIEKLRLSGLPLCMAKTPMSLSDDSSRLGRPRDFPITVRSIRIAAGAGFLIPLLGNVLTMPGLPKEPSACRLHLSPEGEVLGLGAGKR